MQLSSTISFKRIHSKEIRRTTRAFTAFSDISDLFCSHNWCFCNQHKYFSNYPSVIVTYLEMLEMILSVSSWAFPIIPFTKSIVVAFQFWCGDVCEPPVLYNGNWDEFGSWNLDSKIIIDAVLSFVVGNKDLMIPLWTFDWWKDISVRSVV